MINLRPEILAFTRACEQLLTKEVTLTEDERDLLEFYVNDMTRAFLSDRSIDSNPPQPPQPSQTM